MTVLTDSDVLIEVSRGRGKTMVAQWLELGQSDALILYSPVTAALLCVPIDAASGRRAGEYLRRYRKSHAVESDNALIAASAVERGVRLWTRNRKHYPMPELAFYE